jgi:hypothetical protein
MKFNFKHMLRVWHFLFPEVAKLFQLLRYLFLNKMCYLLGQQS